MHIMVILSAISIQSFSVRLSRRDVEEKQTSDKRSDDWMAVASSVLIGRKEHICISKKQQTRQIQTTVASIALIGRKERICISDA